jgi:secreted trypsin-like serine protease
MFPLRRTIPLAVATAALSLTALAGSAAAYVDGHDALADKPFTTGLRFLGGNEFFCTASLLQPSWVLTAAHCVDGDVTTANLELVIGDRNIDNADDPAQTRYADQIVVHPGWSGDSDDGNDVALVHLSTPSTVTPVRLGVTPELVDGIRRCVQQVSRPPFSGSLASLPQLCQSGRGKALGWGRRSMSASGTSHVLREVTPKIYGWAVDTFWRTKAGACPGDSGGPLLVVAADGSTRQIGIASHNVHGGGYFDWLVGDKCSTKGSDYYSDVSAGKLRTWVESVTGVRDHRS